jgi:SAM-dependent methyltransferase
MEKPPANGSLVKRRSKLERARIALRNAARDLRYGSVLAGTIRSRYPELGAFHVTNSEYDDLPHLFAAARLVDEDVIVDVGCGKGRVLNWLLAEHPRNRIVGIELDPEVCSKVARRLRRRANVTILCGDATELVPADASVFYLFNPFDEPVLGRFVDAVADRVTNLQRVRIVYYHARFVDVLRADPRFTVEEIELPSGSQPSALIRVAEPPSRGDSD